MNISEAKKNIVYAKIIQHLFESPDEKKYCKRIKDDVNYSQYKKFAAFSKSKHLDK